MVDWIDEEDMIDRMIIDEKLFLSRKSHKGPKTSRRHFELL